MHKEVILGFGVIFIFLIIGCASASSPQINFERTIQTGETIIGNITGDFTGKINLNDIDFFKGRKDAFFEYDLIFYNGAYYFYVYADKEGNFTIKINNILYEEAGVLKSTTISENFSIGNFQINESKSLSIKPGFIFTSDKADLSLINFADDDLNVTYKFNDLTREITLEKGKSAQIELFPNKSFSYLNIKTYKEFNVPIIYLPLNTPLNQTTNLDNLLRANPRYLHVNTQKDILSNNIIELFNFANENITDLNIKLNTSIVALNYSSFIEAKSSENISVKVYSEKEGYVGDELKINYTLNDKIYNLSIPLEIYIFPENGTGEILTSGCSDLGGNICSFEETCNGTPKYVPGAYCCLGTCFTPQTEEKKSYGWVWGIFIVIILLVGGFFVYRRYSKVKPIKPEEKLKEEVDKYSKRMSGSISRS